MRLVKNLLKSKTQCIFCRINKDYCTFNNFCNAFITVMRNMRQYNGSQYM